MSLRHLAVVALLAAMPAGSALAKNDIRGISTTQSLHDALEALELDGATCFVPDAATDPITCDYNDRTKMTLYAGRKPNTIGKIVYSFSFGALDVMRAKLQQLYGLRKDRIEGEHRLFTGEMFDVELRDDKTGTLSLVKDATGPDGKAGKAR